MLTWKEIVENKAFSHLPYKVETNGHGQIIMSSGNYKHGRFQTMIASLLETLIPCGTTSVEVAVETADGFRVPDVNWISDEHRGEKTDFTYFTVCPEICVEVCSPSNSEEEMEEKKELYFQAGAQEVWRCDQQGKTTFLVSEGELPHSKLCPTFPTQLKPV